MIPHSSPSSWSNGTITVRLADRGDLPDIAEMLADTEVARWLWFGPNKPEETGAFFGPYLDRQAGETAPKTAVFTVLQDGRYVGEGAVVEVEGSPAGYEIGYQLRRDAWGRGVGKTLARSWWLTPSSCTALIGSRPNA